MGASLTSRLRGALPFAVGYLTLPCGGLGLVALAWAVGRARGGSLGLGARAVVPVAVGATGGGLLGAWLWPGGPGAVVGVLTGGVATGARAADVLSRPDDAAEATVTTARAAGWGLALVLAPAWTLAVAAASSAPVTLGFVGVLLGSLAAASVFGPPQEGIEDAPGSRTPPASDAVPARARVPRGAANVATGSAGVAVLFLIAMVLGRAAPAERVMPGVPSPTDRWATDPGLGLRAEMSPGHPDAVLVTAQDGGGPGRLSLPAGHRVAGVGWHRQAAGGPPVLLVGAVNGPTFAVPFHPNGYRLDDGPSARLRAHLPGWLGAVLGLGLGLGAVAGWLRLAGGGMGRWETMAVTADVVAAIAGLVVAAVLAAGRGNG